MRFLKEILILISVSLFTGFAYSQINLTNGLVGYFPLDGNTVDASSMTINGVVNNAILISGKTNNIDSAYFFNGTSADINCSSNNRNITSKTTVSVWVKTVMTNIGWVIGKYDWQVDKGIAIQIKNGHPFVSGRNGSNQSTSTYHSNSTFIVNDGNWHHIVAVVDGNSWSLYVDCQFDTTVISNASNPALDNSEPLSLGYYPIGGGTFNHNYFEGSIDEVRIYNRALTLPEMQLICDINYVDPVLGMPRVSKDTIVCDSTFLTLNAIPDTGTVYWESPQGTIVGSGNAYGALITQSSTFYVYSVLNGITSDTAVINVGVKNCASFPAGPVFSDAALCEGAILQLIAYPDSGIVHWDSPLGTAVTLGNTFTINVTQTALYFVYVQYSTGNSDTSSFNVTMKNCSNVIRIPIAPNDTLVCEDTEVIFKAFRDTGTVYWTSEQGVILDTGTTVTLSVTTDTRIYLYNEVSGQRSDTVSFYISTTECGDEIFPNVFTPNGDGLNDYLYFTIPNATCFTASIYNRWGVLVYEMSEIEFAWDGFVQNTGEPLPDGVYFYTVTYCVSDAVEQQKRGSIMLIR